MASSASASLKSDVIQILCNSLMQSNSRQWKYLCLNRLKNGCKFGPNFLSDCVNLADLVVGCRAMEALSIPCFRVNKEVSSLTWSLAMPPNHGHVALKYSEYVLYCGTVTDFFVKINKIETFNGKTPA